MKFIFGWYLMVSLRTLVGGILRDLSAARIISDNATATIADRYLQHPYLKGFPVPRMHLGNVDIELVFAVADGRERTKRFQDEEIRRQAKSHLAALAEEAWSDHNASGASDAGWTAVAATLIKKVDRILLQPVDDTELLIASLSAAIENALADAGAPRRSLLARFRQASESATATARSTPTSPQPQDAAPETHEATDGPPSSLQSRVRAILFPDPNAANAVLSDVPDVLILVGAEELSQKAPASLQSLKLTVVASDQKWVMSHVNGQEVHTLCR